MTNDEILKLAADIEALSREPYEDDQDLLDIYDSTYNDAVNEVDQDDIDNILTGIIDPLSEQGNEPYYE